ncbi:MAG: Photosynthetic reaction center cytochrome c subunit precursor [Pseudomonadota bacterium]|jgi:photosynthetic reaction center cytochrome c subunit
MSHRLVPSAAWTDPGRRLRRAVLALCGAGLALLAGCDRPPVETLQVGFRGTSMTQVYNPRTLEATAATHALPEITAPARIRAGGPTAGAVYQNVKVLGDLSLGEFGRTMDAFTLWIAPRESCSYCHVEGNFADDSKYTKVVARRMIQMSRHVNAAWSAHVGETGVTCWTCHRGQAVPSQVWFRPVPAPERPNGLGDRAGQNAPARAVALASLPSDPFTPYLADRDASAPIRVQGGTALPSGNRSSTKQAEFSYGLMMHMSGALGVNCTYCHNSRAFSSWEESTPARATAWHGIRMVRDLNSAYLEPLGTVFPEVPAGRLGPMKDSAKVNCATCHQGAYKPLYGARMAGLYPALTGRPAVDPDGLAAR